MAKGPKANGNGTSKVRGESTVLPLMERGLDTSSLGAFTVSFMNIHQRGAIDVGRGRHTVAEWNAMRNSYSNILRAVDLNLRAQRLGVAPKSKNLLGK